MGTCWRCEGTCDRVFLMTCQTHQGRRTRKSSFSCVMRVPLVTLVTLFSISNRRSRILRRGRAARSREARVEPESRGIQTQQEDRGGEQQQRGTDPPRTQPSEDADSFAGRPVTNRKKKKALLRLLGYLDYTHSLAASKDTKSETLHHLLP